MINSLPDLHKFLKGKIELSNDQLFVNLTSQEFNEKSLPTFIQRITQIPESVKNLTFIMKDIQYQDDYIPKKQDFQALQNLHNHFTSIKFDFQGILNEGKFSPSSLELVADFGQEFIKKMEQIQSIELNYSKYFKLLINENQLVFSFKNKKTISNNNNDKDDKNDKNQQILGKVNGALVEWRKELNYIEIELNSVVEYSKLLDLLKCISTHKEVRVLKMKMQCPSLGFLEKKEISNYIYNLLRKSLKVVIYTVDGKQPFQLLPLIQNLNSSLNLAHFKFTSENKDLFDIFLKGNVLKTNFNIKNGYTLINQRDVENSLISQFKTWKLDKVDILEIIDDSNMNIFIPLLHGADLKNLKQLTIKLHLNYSPCSNSYYNKNYLSSVNFQTFTNALKYHTHITHFSFNASSITFENKQIKAFCQYLNSLEDLENLSLNFQKTKFSDPKTVCQILRDNLISLSDKLKIFHYVCPNNSPLGANVRNNISHLIPLFASLKGISEFTVEDTSQHIKFKDNKLNLSLNFDQIAKIDEVMNSFSNTTLLNTSITHLDITLIVYQPIYGGESLLKPFLNDIKSSIESIVIYLRKDFFFGSKSDSYFSFNIPLGQYKGDFSLYFNNHLRIRKEKSLIEIHIKKEDQRQTQQQIIQNERINQEQKNQIEVESSDSSDSSDSYDVWEENNQKGNMKKKQIVIELNDDDDEDEIREEKRDNKKDNIAQIDSESEEIGKVKKEKTKQMKDKDREMIDAHNTEEQEMSSNEFNGILNVFKTEDYEKECIINCQYYDLYLFKYLAANIPKYQSLQLNLQDIGLDDEKLIQLRNIFLHTSNTLKSFKIDISQNSKIHNQGSITLFLKLHILQRSLQTLSINLANTSIRSKGILSLANKISKFKQIQHLTLNISQPNTIYPLNSSILGTIFRMVSSSSKPLLESFVFIGKKSQVQMDQAFFNNLYSAFDKFPETLKKLHLDFSQNNFKQVESIEFEKLKEHMKNLPQGLEYFHFDIVNIDQFNERIAIQFVQAAQIFIKNRCLNYFFYNSPYQIINSFTEHYFLSVTNLLLLLIAGKHQEVTFQTLSTLLKIQQKQLTQLQCSNLLNHVVGSNQMKELLSCQFYKQLMNVLPLEFNLSAINIQLFD